jgi:hypothetical protein
MARTMRAGLKTTFADRLSNPLIYQLSIYVMIALLAGLVFYHGVPLMNGWLLNQVIIVEDETRVV